MVLAELKTDPGQVGLETLLREIDKLAAVRALGLPPELFADASEKLVVAWRARAVRSYPSDFRAAPRPVRLTLLAALCTLRAAEITDALVELLIGLIHRINARADLCVERELTEDLRRVRGKAPAATGGRCRVPDPSGGWLAEPSPRSSGGPSVAIMTNGARATARVVVLVLPEVNLLDLAGPVQVFDAANHLGAQYRVEFVADTGEVASAQGLRLAGLGTLPEVRPGDLVLVPGPRLRPDAGAGPLVSDEVVWWLRAATEQGAHLASVCTGAAALGEAGLLDGRRCTTHWALIDAMRRRYPAARVQDGVLYVHDGPVSTSAGISAGIDLALSLVERDHGPTLTAGVARELVVYLRRDGTTPQVSAFLEHRTHLNSAVHRVQDHLAQRLDIPHTLAELAAVAHLSPRGLSRAFSVTTGMSPLQYQQRLRLDFAAALLAQTDLTVRTVAARCGFRDERHLRRLFAARFGTPPSAARQPTTRS